MRIKMNPIKKLLKQTLHLILIFGMIFNYCPIVSAEDEQAQKEILISGEWDVTYSDRYLGGVHGKAVVSEDGKTATVTYTHPDTNEEYSLISTSIKRDENKITIELEGESPRYRRMDGLNYPYEPIIIHETSKKLKAQYGESNKSLSIGPRKPSDLNKVTLEMKAFSHDQIGGRWYYYADDVTYSDTDGYGRHGHIIKADDGRVVTQGYERWQKPKLKIYGVFTIENQLDNDRGVTSYHYPFGSKPLNIGKHRYLFIFGENLPTKFTDPVTIEHDDEEHIYYGNPTKMEAIEGNVFASDQYKRAFKKLLESLPESEHERAKKFEALIVRADLKPGVVPGYHTFTLNGVEKGWLLQFGDNFARAGFSRKIRQPTGISTYEWTKDLFLPEVVYVEVHTQVELPVDEISVVVGVDGNIVNLAGGTKIMAKRIDEKKLVDELAQLKKAYNSEKDEEDKEEYRRNIKRIEMDIAAAKRIFRTKALTLKRGIPTKENSNYTVFVQQYSKVTAYVAEPKLISINPPVAMATVWGYPGEVPVAGKTKTTKLNPSATPISATSTVKVLDDIPVNARWRDYLQKAYSCDNDREDIDWTKVSQKKSDDINKYVVLNLRILSTRIDIGDHAAMIYLRQTFLGLIEEKDKELAKIKDDISVEAFRRYIEPYVWNDNYAIRHIMVKGKNGEEVFFPSTFLEDGAKHSHKLEEKEHKEWIKKATIEAITKLRAQFRKAYEFAEKKDVCDVEEMLELTGVGFGNIVELASSRLMRLNDDPTKPAGWIPHYPARGYLTRLPILWETTKLHEKISEYDTSMLLLSMAVLSLPVIMYGGTVGIVAGIAVDVIDIAATSYIELSKAYEKDVEVEFALQASEFLGEERKQIADNIDTSWTRAVGTILLSGVGILFGVDEYGKLYKAYKTPLAVKRIVRGRKLVDTLKTGAYKNLKVKQKKDLFAFIVNARKKELSHGILDEVEEAALRDLRKMDEMDAALARRGAGAPPKVPRQPKAPDPGDSLFGDRYREILGPQTEFPGDALVYWRLMLVDIQKAAPKRLMKDLESLGVSPAEVERIAKGGTEDLIDAIMKTSGAKEISSKEAIDLMQLSVRASKGTATAKDVEKLLGMVEDARKSGGNFWDDLAFKGTLGEDGFQVAVPDKAMRDAMKELAQGGAPSSSRLGVGEDTLPPPGPGAGGKPAPFSGDETLPPPAGKTRPPPTGDAAGAADELAETVRFGEDGRPLADGSAGDAHRTLEDLANHEMGRGLDEYGRPLVDGAAGRAHDSLDTIARHEMGRGLDEFGRPLADGAAGRAHDSLETIAKHDMGSEVAKPGWMSKVDDAIVEQIEGLLHRSDIHTLMDDAAELVQKSLKGADAEEVMDLLKYSPHLTGEQLEASLKTMRKRIKEAQGEAFFKQADDKDIDLLDELEAHGWVFGGRKPNHKDSYVITFTDPLGETGSALRSWDEATGTFKMEAAFREQASPWIKKGLDKTLVLGKGVPTIMFVNMRFMNAFGIGYAGKAGKLMKHVKMEHIINPRSAIQLEWMRRTNFPEKTFEEAVADGSFNEYVRHCFSVKYAEDAITMAGYRIKGVRIELDHLFSPGGSVGGLKGDYVGKVPWEDLLKRYGLEESSEVNTFFNIIIDVEPL